MVLQLCKTLESTWDVIESLIILGSKTIVSDILIGQQIITEKQAGAALFYDMTSSRQY